MYFQISNRQARKSIDDEEPSQVIVGDQVTYDSYIPRSENGGLTVTMFDST